MEKVLGRFILIISKKNEVYLNIKTEPNYARELSDFFTFEVPGARFMPSYRNKYWDGKIRLFNQMNGEVYVGLLPYIEEFAKRNELDIEYKEGVKDEGEHRTSILGGFVRRVSPKSKGKTLQIRDYQMAAFTHAVRNNRSLSLSPTASGKSLIIYLLSRWYESNRVLILVPTTSLVEQMYTDFLDYGYVESKMQKIYQGHSREITKEITISTWQSLYKMPKKYFEQFGCILGDEVHLFKAKSLTNIMNKMHQTQYRHGFTGTLDGTQTHRLVLEGLFGRAEKVVSTKELMDKKSLAQLKIKCIILKHSNIREKFSYAEELDYIVTNENRINFCCDLLRHLSGNTLCLFQLVEKHGKVLYDKIGEDNAFFVYGATSAEQREEIRAIVDRSDKSITIASYGTFSTGINIRNINNIVLASPSKSKIRVLQSIGRGLRIAENKNSVLIFDIADDLGNDNYTLRHFTERLNIYNEEQFDYDISKVKLK